VRRSFVSYTCSIYRQGRKYNEYVNYIETKGEGSQPYIEDLTDVKRMDVSHQHEFNTDGGKCIHCHKTLNEIRDERNF